LGKSDEIRCSNWSARTLSDRQIQYAALDAIKTLEVYQHLAPLPDLSERLEKNPDAAQPYVEVDIVPPHCNRRPTNAARGYRVADLATRAAVGRILPDQTLDYPDEFTPKKARVGENTRVVEITQVLAPSLLLPSGTTIGAGVGRRRACLADFTSTSTGSGSSETFKVILPLSMLKNHVESPRVRVFGGKRSDVNAERRITPPSSAPGKSSERRDTVIEEIDGDDDEINRIFGESGSGDDNVLNENARETMTAEVIDLIKTAALEAKKTQKQRGTHSNFMVAEHLDAPPEIVWDAFSAVLGDPFHGMKRARVDVNHEYKKPYCVALMLAWFLWDEDSLEKVKEVLKGEGFTQSEIDSLMYFKPSFFTERVERKIPPPSELYWRVRAVFITFGNKIDSSTGRPLFNAAAWTKANNVLKEIQLGYYSDPPGHNFYTIRLTDEGTPKEDKYGITLIDCCRGTNDVENAHRIYTKTFSNSVTGVEYGSCLMINRLHRHNIRMGRRYIAGYPWLGHYDTWKLDRLQKLIEKNHGLAYIPGHHCTSDYRGTAETFQTVAIHSKALHDAVAAIELSDKVKFSRDLQFICDSIGVRIPFLPVNGKEEYMLFTLLVHEMSGFDAERMAIEWCKYVDGEAIFPKLPVYLREYYKRWQRNKRIQDAIKNMKPELELLAQVNKQHTPSELAPTATNEQEEFGSVESTDVCLTGNGDNAWMGAAFPLPIPPPMPCALRPLGDTVYVGIEATGTNYDLGHASHWVSIALKKHESQTP